MPFATNKMRILGEIKDPKTGAFTPEAKQPVVTPKPKPMLMPMKKES
jgi:hypothetical protein